jgi:hypothetical protein
MKHLMVANSLQGHSDARAISDNKHGMTSTNFSAHDGHS